MSQARIAELQAELALLLAESKEETSELKSSDHQEKAEEKKSSAFCTSQGTLDSSQVARYSRQVILPEVFFYVRSILHAIDSVIVLLKIFNIFLSFLCRLVWLHSPKFVKQVF